MFTDSLVQEIHQAAGEYQQPATVVPLPFSGYPEYLLKGERFTFEKSYFARRRQLAILALDYWLQPQPEKKPLLEQVIWEICNEYSWGLPAHLPQDGENYHQDSRQWIDLFAAETAESLAEIKQLLNGELSSFLITRIDLEIEERLLRPFEENDWGWEDKQNNWSSVIASCIGLVTLYQVPEGERQSHLLKKLDRAFTSYFTSFYPDGACVEGVGYWVYGFGYYVYFAEKMASLKGDCSYLKPPAVKEIASFPYHTWISEENFVPFSDYNKTSLPSGLLCFCQQELAVPIPPVQQVSPLDFDHCYRFAHLLRNLIWTVDNQTDANFNHNHWHLYPDAQWLLGRFPTADFYFAAKGGRNDESHNQNDLGHFVVGSQQQLFLTDLGAGLYNQAYFDEAQRYTIFVNQSLGHSVPIVNEQLQQAGPYESRICDVTAKPLTYTLELQEAYPVKAQLKSLQRAWQIFPEEEQLVMIDEYQFHGENNQVIENLITLLPVAIKANQAIITGERQQCVLTFETEKLKIIEKVYEDHQGKLTTCSLIQSEYGMGEKGATKLTLQLKAK